MPDRSSKTEPATPRRLEKARKEGDIWEMPYLPIDPLDLGRSYEAVIRVNSQSGKGGITYLLEHEYGLSLPRRLQIEFSQIVQAVMDDSGKEVTAGDIWGIFEREYLVGRRPFEYVAHHLVVHGCDRVVVHEWFILQPDPSESNRGARIFTPELYLLS